MLAIVPAHNEAPRVGAVVEGLIARGLPVLVVDDGSSDGTGDEAREAGARVLRLEPNRGKGGALKAGFRAALGEERPPGAGSPAPVAESTPAGGWAAILTLDGDGQHDPAEVSAFLEARANTGADLVVGARDYRRLVHLSAGSPTPLAANSSRGHWARRSPTISPAIVSGAGAWPKRRSLAPKRASTFR